MVFGLPRKRAQNIIIQHVGLETLVYDESCHRAFCLNPSSAAIWNHCDGTRSVEDLATAATAVLGIAVSEDVVLFALDELRRDGLLEADTLPLHAISRRALVQRIGYGSALLLPIVATIVAPKAAQAYGGCFDCSSDEPAPTRGGLFGDSDDASKDDDSKNNDNRDPLNGK